MPIRLYDFVAGVETDTPPTPSDPSTSGDVVTKGYADKSYARGLATIAAVKSIGSSDRTDNLPIFIDQLQAWFYFDAASSATGDDLTVIQPTSGTGRWLKIPVGAGGGGAGSLRVIEGPNSPVKTFESGVEYYEYGPALGQSLYLIIPVPSAYVPGVPITMKIKWSCASSSGDVLLRTTTTLIRLGVDVYTSTTNQRTSTNSAVSMAAGMVNEIQETELDLSSSIGQINSVGVSGSDKLKIQLTEASSTVADNIKWFFDLTEVSFFA